MAQEPYPIGSGAPKVNVIASVDARDQGTGHAPGLGGIVDGPVMASKRSPPPEKVPASIAAGGAPVPAGRGKKGPPPLPQINCPLSSRGAQTHPHAPTRRHAGATGLNH